MFSASVPYGGMLVVLVCASGVGASLPKLLVGKVVQKGAKSLPVACEGRERAKGVFPAPKQCCQLSPCFAVNAVCRFETSGISCVVVLWLLPSVRSEFLLLRSFICRALRSLSPRHSQIPVSR